MAQGETRTMRSGAVAAALGLSAATIQSYARNGRLPHSLTPGGQYRFDMAEVRDVLGLWSGPVAELRDVFAPDSGVLVDAISGYRPDPVTPEAVSRLRARGVRASQPAAPAAGKRVPWTVTAGSAQFELLVLSSRGAAVAVLHREPVDA